MEMSYRTNHGRSIFFFWLAKHQKIKYRIVLCGIGHGWICNLLKKKNSKKEGLRGRIVNVKR
jgi:hypothetical protein